VRALALLLAPSIAFAQPTKDEVARADALFRAAQSLFEAGSVSEACVKFAESQKLDPAPGTLLNLAVCHEREGKTATAYGEYKQVAEIAAKGKTADDRERLRFARDAIAKLEPRLTRVVVEAPAQVSAELDGKPAPHEPLLVDPGPHAIKLSAAGKKTKNVTWNVPAQPGTHTFHAPDLEDDGAPPKRDDPVKPKETPKPQPPVTVTAPTYPTRTLGIVMGGLGVATLGVAGYFGLDTFSRKDERDQHCRGDVCNARGIELHDQAGTSATLATVLFAGGLVLVGAGIYFFVREGPSKPTALRIWPGGLAGSFP
jgi:hypothetical protein